MKLFVALKLRDGVRLTSFDIPGGMGDAETEIMIQEKLVESDRFRKSKLVGWNSDKEELRQYMKQKYGSFFKGDAREVDWNLLDHQETSTRPSTVNFRAWIEWIVVANRALFKTDFPVRYPQFLIESQTPHDGFEKGELPDPGIDISTDE